MGTTRAIILVLLAGELAASAALGQYPELPSPADGTPPVETAPMPGEILPRQTPEQYLGELSDWMTYRHGPGCGPVGANGLIGMDLYVRTGPTWLLAQPFFRDSVGPGWMVDGGGRTLFFNPAHRAAWLVDLGLSFKYNDGNSPDHVFSFAGQDVSVRALYRTDIHFGGGREWYLLGSAIGEQLNWRFGLDGGGRWGTVRLDLNASDEDSGFLRENSESQGMYAGFYSDLQFPMGCCTLFGGFRLEYNVTWSDIVPRRDDTMEDLNFLLMAGVRF